MMFHFIEPRLLLRLELLVSVAQLAALSHFTTHNCLQCRKSWQVELPVWETFRVCRSA